MWRRSKKSRKKTKFKPSAGKRKPVTVRRRLSNAEPEEKKSVATEIFSSITKRSFRRKVLKFGLYAAVAFLVLFSIVATFISYKVDGDFLKSELIRIVSEETNGRLELGDVTFSVWKGLEIDSIALYPLALKYEKQIPLFTAEKLDLRYKLWKVMFLNLTVSSAKLINPKINVYKIEDQMNFERMLARNKAPVEKTGPGAGKYLKYAIPLWANLQNIGFDNLDVTFSEELEKNITRSYHRLYNLSFNIDMNWILFKNDGLIRLFSPNNRPTYIKSITPNSDKDILVKIDMDNRIVTKDFTHVFINLKNTLAELKSSDRKFENLPSHFDAEIKLANDFESVDIRKFNFSVGEILKMISSGKVSIVNGMKDVYLLDTKTTLDIDLKKAEKPLSVLISDLKLQGRIALKKAVIAGKLSTKKDEHYSLPNAAVLLSMDKVSLSSSELGLDIRDLQNDTEVNVTHSLISGGMTIAAQNNLSLKQATASAKSENDVISTATKDLESRITLQAQVPDLAIPNLQVQVSSPEITGSSKTMGAVKTNLSLNSTFSSTQDFKSISTSGQLEIGAIADSYWLVQCEDKCEKQRANMQFSMVSLGNLYNLAKPLLVKSLEKNQVPKSMAGSVQFKMGTKGHIPYQSTTNQSQLLELSDITLDSSLAINNFSTEIPLMGIKVTKMDLDVSTSGDYFSQLIKIDHSVPSLEIKPDGFKERVHITDLNTQVEIINTFTEKPKPGSVPEKFTTDVSTDLAIGSVEAKDLMPIPIDTVRLALKVSQENLKNISVQKMDMSIPSLGFRADNTTTLVIDKSFKPKSFTTKGRVSSEKDIGKTEIAKIRTAGKMDAQYEFKSPDLDYFDLSSQLSFDHFTVEVPTEDGKSSKILIDNLHGSIPFTQKVSLSKAKTKMNESGYFATETKNKEDKSDEQIIEKYYQDVLKREERRTNLVEKADFGNIKPFYDQNNRITIKKFQADKIKAEDIVVDFEISDNEVKLKNYSLSFLGGAIQGNLGLAMEVLPVELSTAIHFTNLNANRLFDEIPELKKKAKKINADDSKKIDGTVHFNYDFLSHSMEGNIDITSIGKEQLSLLLYYIDPDEKNPNISSLRKALIVGDLRLVKIPITNGHIGLDLDLRLLGAPIPLPQISKFPVSQIVRNFEISAKKSLTEEISH